MKKISKQEYWSGFSFPSPGDLPNLGIELTSLASLALAGRFLTTGVTWEARRVLCTSRKEWSRFICADLKRYSTTVSEKRQYPVELIISSVSQSCPTLCDPRDCSMTGFPVHHQLQELTQIHVHHAGDAIQPSHPLSFILLPPSTVPSIRVFSKELVLRIRWPK